jgi:adenosylcobinamide-phosphate synthase
MLFETLPGLVAALSIDALFGYPDFIFRAIGHPVTWIGALIASLDRRLNREDWPEGIRKATGALTAITISALAFGAALGLQDLLMRLPVPTLWVGLAGSTLLASRSLYQHVREVADALDGGGLDAGRKAVARIVGRDPKALDEAGVARAAIESLAENASDGIVAPVFWFALLGLPGVAAYKAINTADSMIGHRSPCYRAFGWAAARLDDVVNLPASRLTAALFILAANFRSASPRGAFQAVMRDAPRHRSPNAGWPEAAMAGALGLKLAGPRVYDGVLVPDAYMGNGRAEAGAADIRRALALAETAWGVMAASIAVLTAIILF